MTRECIARRTSTIGGLVVAIALVTITPGAAALPGHTAPTLRITRVGYARYYRSLLPPAPGRVTVPMSLPLHIGRPLRGNSPPDRWFRIDFALPAQSATSAAVYLIYVSPAVMVYLNGAYIGASEGFNRPNSQSWNYPLLLPFTRALLHNDRNTLWIDLRGYMGGATELGPIWIGPQRELYERYQKDLWLRVLGVEVVSLLVGGIGLFAFLLWWRSRHQAIFRLFAASCAIWIVRNTQFFLVHTYFSPFHYMVITDAALFWLNGVLFVLCFRIAEQRFPRIERGIFAFALFATLAMWLAGPQYKWRVTALLYLAIFPGSAVFLAYLTRIAWRRRTVLLSLLWLAAMVTTIAGGYDLLLMTEIVPWPAAYLMPYSALFFAGTVGWALIDRYVVTQNEYARLTASLEQRVRERESELDLQYRRNAEFEQERALTQERERILRDMHDGVGLHLISSMQLAERGELSREQMRELLGDTMDELRIAIDSVKPTAGDLLVMLGNLRYRLEPRLAAVGITLDWSVEHIDGLSSLDPPRITEITRIVQEAFSNVLKHAGASRIRVQIDAPPDAPIVIALVDNGRGFDTHAASPGEGLRSMRARAVRIGGTLTIGAPQSGTGTRIELCIPPLGSRGAGVLRG